MPKFFTPHLSVGTLIVGVAALVGPPAAAEPGAVFVGTNHNNMCLTRPALKPTDTSCPDGLCPCPTLPGEPANQVLMYNRAADGALTLIDRFDTGGQGSGPSIRFAGDGLGAAPPSHAARPDAEWRRPKSKEQVMPSLWSFVMPRAVLQPRWR